MATIVKTDAGTWKVVVRMVGWPMTTKTFRTKRDASDWARKTEDELVRGAYIRRAAGDRTTFKTAMARYLSEVVPTKRPTSQYSDAKRSKSIVKHLGSYSLAALTPEIIARFRDMRLAGEDRKNSEGNPRPRANNTVRLDLALLGHLYTVALKEWGIGLPGNPVSNIRRPSPGPGAIEDCLRLKRSDRTAGFSDSGRYAIAISENKAGDQVLAKSAGAANEMAGKVTLRVILDLRAAKAGQYYLATIRGADNGRYYYPLKIN